MDEMKKIILDLKEKYNLRCVEAINNRQTIEEEKELVKFCKKNNFITVSKDKEDKYKRRLLSLECRPQLFLSKQGKQSGETFQCHDV